MVRALFTIKNTEGLHARPASELCKKATEFQSKILLWKDGEAFEAKSILMVLCLGAAKGDVIELSAEGEDEKEAVAALIELLEHLE